MTLTRRKVLYIFFALLFLLVVSNFFRAVQPQGSFLSFSGGHRIYLEIADTPEERMLGLFLMETLPEDRGMLFIFEEEEPLQVWTRHYSFPVDLLWLDRGFEVVHLEKDVPPCQEDPCPLYTPSNERARYAVQIAAGQIEAQGTRKGETLSVYRLG